MTTDTLTTKQIAKVLKPIRAMEKACLSSDSPRTTAREIRENGLAETKKYFYWLKRQAPVTGMFYDFDKLISEGC